MSLALKELNDEDLSEGQVVLEAAVLNGTNLKLCMNISHPDINIKLHPQICQVCLSCL